MSKMGRYVFDLMEASQIYFEIQEPFDAETKIAEQSSSDPVRPDENMGQCAGANRTRLEDPRGSDNQAASNPLSEEEPANSFYNSEGRERDESDADRGLL
tara:strand:- start:4833 stop:5132 length:300 start_codon:yes stop_codon:yes gene_type:complete